MNKFSEIDQLDFSKIKGNLIPVIAQDYLTNEVLMLAFANRQAIERTIETGYAHYYSRSRQKMWKKGETSGHIQEIKVLIADCDNDSVLIKVKQNKGACHKGYYSCFHKILDNGKFKVKSKRIFDPKEVYEKSI